MLRQSFNRREFDRLQRDMDRLFDASFPFIQRQRGSSLPAINIWSNKEDGVIVTAELPGFSPDNIDITVTGNTLKLTGKRPADAQAENIQYHRRERVFGEFTRTIQLPYAVDTGAVEADMEQGVLQIALPRAETEKPKQITVKSSY